MDSGLVLLQQHHPGYIRWEEYFENQQMIEHNQTNQPEMRKCAPKNRLAPGSPRISHGRSDEFSFAFNQHTFRGLRPRRISTERFLKDRLFRARINKRR